MNEHVQNMRRNYRIRIGKEERSETNEKQIAAARANAAQNWRRPIIYGKGRR